MGKMKATNPQGGKPDRKMHAVYELRARDREQFFKSGRLPMR